MSFFIGVNVKYMPSICRLFTTQHWLKRSVSKDFYTRRVANAGNAENFSLLLYIYFPPFIFFFPLYFLLKIDIFDIKEIKY